MNDIFKKYQQLKEDYRKGLLSKFMYEEMSGELFSKSGYDSPIEFTIDYMKWEKGQEIHRVKQLKLLEDTSE